MRYEQEVLEKIMYYDKARIISSFPLYVYRTRDKVNRNSLETAIGHAIQCHPRFGCRLVEDSKGPHLETNPEKPVIANLNPSEEYFFGGESNNHYPWVVGIHDDEIVYTGFHGLTDGVGATIFMRTVLYYYFREQGFSCDPGEAVTLEDVTPEHLERDTERSVMKNGSKDYPSTYDPGALRPSVFPDDLLDDAPDDCSVHNIAISLPDVRKKCAEYGVSQSAVIATRIAQAICDVLPGTDNVVLMNVVADMRRALDSVTTHNCVMTVPVTFSQRDLAGQSEECVCKAFRSKLIQGCNREEALHSCFNSAMMNRQVGGSKEGLAGAAAQIAKRYGLNRPTASVAYTHLTHTGFSDDVLALLDDVYVNYAGLETVGKQALNAICAVTTNRLINLMIIDGTKGELIVRAFEKRLAESQISFEDRILERYKGVTFER